MKCQLIKKKEKKRNKRTKGTRHKEKNKIQKNKERMKMNPLFVGLLALLIVCSLYHNHNPLPIGAGGVEGFTLYSPKAADGNELAPKYVESESDPLLVDMYPTIGRNDVSNDSASTMWWQYPTFKLPSFAQHTNNLEYYKNPDIGTCMRPEMCGALYHDELFHKSNEIMPLPPAETGSGARVGYFRTPVNRLFFSINSNDNILY